MTEVDLPTSRGSQSDLIHFAGPWSGPLDPIILPTPRTSPLFHASRLWDIWSDYFHEDHRVPNYRHRQLLQHHCAKATDEHFMSYRSLIDHDLEQVYRLGLSDFLVLSLPAKFEALERALRGWVSSGANLDVKDSAGLTPLLVVQSSSARGNWKYINLLIRNGADRHATDPAQGSGPLQLALIWLRIHSASGNLGARRYGYLVEMEKRLIVLLEAGCYGNATDFWGNTPPESTQDEELCWVVWKRALGRVEARKSLSPAARDADLRCKISSHSNQYIQWYRF
jgi:hypothetical protein